MSKNLIIVILVVLVSMGAVVVARNTRSEKTPEPQPLEQKVQKSFSTKSDSQGEVAIEVTPKILEADKEVIFQITLNTHSVELDKDLSKISKLKDDLGNEYVPVSWSGGVGGHHLSGDLIFPKISGQAKSVTLTISGIGESERTLQWEL